MKEYTSDLKSKNNFGSAMEHYISDLKGPQQNKQGKVFTVNHGCVAHNQKIYHLLWHIAV